MKWLTLEVSLVILGISWVEVISRFAVADGINVGGKLDFRDSGDHKPHLIERLYVTSTNDKRVDDKNKNENIGKIGVICASGGCNTTKATQLEGSDTISADVIVEVKTSLNANDAIQNREKSDDEDVPDVPVVIGYGGVMPDRPSMHLNPHENALNPNPIVVTSFEQSFPELSHHVKNGNGFIPTLSVGAVLPQVNIQMKPQDADRDFRYPDTYKFYVDKPAFQPAFQPLAPRWKTNNYGLVQRPAWNYNPAPWYRRNYPNNFDQDQSNYIRPTSAYSWTTCSCHPNSVWTPTTPSYAPIVPLNQPGKQINDKLAPLT